MASFNKKSLTGILLIPFVPFYMLGGFLSRCFKSTYYAKCKVVCIGNISVGGVGKTPIVIEIARQLTAIGMRVGILSRGYRGRLSSNNPILVDIKKHTAKDIGDEVFETALRFKTSPIVICKNRGRGARLIEDKVDVIVMDDGLQNPTLHQDVRVCVINGGVGFSNGMLLPAGRLREPISKIKTMDMVVISGDDKCGIRKVLSKFKKPIFKSSIKSDFDFKKYRGAAVIAVAGIGMPNKFFDMLRANGVSPVREISFFDHYDYKMADIKNLIKIADGYGATILTTYKDFVKFPRQYQKYFVPVGINAILSSEFIDEIINKIS